MKKILTIIAILTLLAGCSAPLLTPPEISPQLPQGDGMGAVRITLNTGARTAMPVQFDVTRLYYTLTFTSNANGEEIAKTVNRQSSFTVELPVGSWHLSITGFASASDAEDGEKILVQGSKNEIVVLPDDIPTVNVVLTPHQSNVIQTQTGRGVLRYDITLPEGGTAAITASALDGTQKLFYNLNSTTSANTISLSGETNNGAREMISDFYLIIITARLNSKEKVWRELVQIYDNAITELAHEFTEDDITNDTTAAIESFRFTLPTGYFVNDTQKTIDVVVPPDTDITALTPVINYSGVLIEPAQGEATDFTEPFIYTVYAENGAQTSYTVTVTDTITTTTLLDSYLQNNPSNDLDNPVPAKVTINLLNNGLSSMLSVLDSRSKYVALDLSGSSGTTFDPGFSSAGKNWIVSLILPDSVTSIGSSAFSGCTGLTSITIPSSVTSIGSSAFSGCTGLTSITIPDSVTSIGSSAFGNCENLTVTIQTDKIQTTQSNNWSGIFSGTTGLVVIFAEGITSIGNYAFSGCTGLTGVTIPDSVTSIGYDAFSGCNGLQNVIIGNGVTSLNRFNFQNNTNLTSITIGNGVTGIGEQAFYGCTGLTSVTIGNSVTSIGNYAFYNCTGLTSVTIPDSVTSIGTYVFYGCTGLTSVTIPDSVTSIGNQAFRGCTGLTSVNIPDSVTSIGTEAFRGCTGLTSVTIPDSVTSIGTEAFRGCTGLTSITIPDSVTVIGNQAFANCENLTVTIQGNWDFSSSNYTLATIFSDNTGLVVIFGDGVTSIGTMVFYNCTGLTSITIPDSVTSIGNQAFRGCTGLTSVTIPDSVTSIGSSAFYGCAGLTSITIPDSVTSIGSSAFGNCENLTVTIQTDKIQTTSSDNWSGIFSGTTGLVVIFEEGITSIGDYAFYGTSSQSYRFPGLTGVTIPDSVTSIGSSAFSGCTGLTSVTFNGTITSSNFSSSSSFPGDLRAKYLAAGTGGPGIYTTTSPGNDAVWTKGIANITAPSWRDGNAISLVAPTIVLPAGDTVTAQGWQISDDGGSGWSNFTATTADMSYNGKYLRYYATSSGGQTYYSNTATIVIYASDFDPNQVTIAMYDSAGDGWNGNGALRININGDDIATDVKVQTSAAQNTPSGQRSSNTYTFSVQADDVVQLYWISGDYQSENSFIVYYTNMPPSPAFTASNNNSWNGDNALVFRLLGTLDSISGGTLLGSFTVP